MRSPLCARPRTSRASRHCRIRCDCSGFRESIPLCNLFQHLLKYLVKRSRRCANQEDIMRARQTAFLGAVALLAVTAANVETAPRAAFDRVVVFGASLSDSGNAFA